MNWKGNDHGVIWGTVESECLWLIGTGKMITNSGIHCQCKMPIWFQELMKYRQYRCTNMKKHKKHESLFVIKYRHFLEVYNQYIEQLQVRLIP
jgi:hypothetical protein